MVNKKPKQERKNIKYTKRSLQIFGLILYIILFAIIIPIHLNKLKYFTFMEAYFPNLDLIATSVSWKGGPFKIWKDLYPSNATSKYQFMSQSIVNYFALIGLTYLIAKESVKKKNIISGWSLGFIMILMTYLLPSNFVITPFMEYISNNTNDFKFKKFAISGAGILIASFIIYLESNILKYFHKELYNIGHFVVNFPKYF